MFKSVLNGEIALYYWMFKIFDGKRKVKSPFRRKENIYMIWEYLFSRKK